MVEGHELQLARAAFARHDWVRARERFGAAEDLSTDDLTMLAAACWWQGRLEENLRHNAEVHRRRLAEGAPAQAALVAVEIGFCEELRGHQDDGAAWMARARRLFDEVPDVPERGYLLGIDAFAAVDGGNLDEATRLAEQVLALGDRHGDPTLQAQGLFLGGVLALRRGQPDVAQARLDEALLPVVAGEVVPEWAGTLYCRMIQLCHELADVPRARRWIELTEDWCHGYGPMDVFTSICRVHRVQLMQVSGDWARAAAQAERATEDLRGLDVVVVAEAYYLLGEMRRLRGDVVAAEEAYLDAHRHGRDPLPGLALLNLCRGRGAVAASALDAALAAQQAPLHRAPLLAGRAEVAVAAGELRRASECVDELDRIAEWHRSPGWRAEALRWRGAVLLARRRGAAAVRVLGEARNHWHEIGAPHRVSCIRLDLAEAYAALGDHDSAARERAEAAAVLEQLGAQPDLARLPGRGEPVPGGLSPREQEVLAAIAEGGSNREAAERLHISDRTVARHLANVYLKTGVSSRTAAVAWGRRHGLL